jgi:hypothetical protein
MISAMVRLLVDAWISGAGYFFGFNNFGPCFEMDACSWVVATKQASFFIYKI